MGSSTIKRPSENNDFAFWIARFTAGGGWKAFIACVPLLGSQMNIVVLVEEFVAKAIDAISTGTPPETPSFDLMDVTLVLLVSSILSLMIAKTYQATYRGLSYSQSLVQTLVILGTVVSVVILVVGSSLARAFALFGALSIVRFRNAVKETRDLGFVFFAMTIGMAIGTRYYSLGILATALVCSMIHLMTLADFGRKPMTEFLLELQIPASVDYVKLAPPLLRNELASYSLVSLEGLDTDTDLLTFVINFKLPRFQTIRALLSKMGLKQVSTPPTVDARSSRLVHSLKEINTGMRVAILQGDRGIEL